MVINCWSKLKGRLLLPQFLTTSFLVSASRVGLLLLMKMDTK